MAVMALSETLHADDRHRIDGAGDATPVIVTEPFSPAWYIETIRRLLHAGRARDSYQMARIAADQASWIRRWRLIASSVTVTCHIIQRFWRLSTRSVTTPGSVSVEVSPSSA